MPNPGRAFVGTRRYAILFTCSAQPPIVTKEYRHVTLTADHARNFTSCVRQASCHRPHGKLPMSSVSAWSRRSVPSRMQPRPAGLYDSPLEGDGFELPVPQQIHSRFRVRARSIGMHRKVRFRSRFRAGGRWIPSVPGKETTLVGRPRSIPRNSPSAKETVAPGTDGSNPPPSSGESIANLIFGCHHPRIPQRTGGTLG